MSQKSERLSEVIRPVEQDLARSREVLLAQLRGGSDAVSDMVDHISRFRGKQLRSAVVLLAGHVTGNSTDEHPTIAAIVEMIHLATLVHDDVLDGAKVRRRVASVNQRWDNQVAVLLGDFLYARAFSMSTSLSSRLCSEVLSITTQKICVGEIEQAQCRYDFEMDEKRYDAIAGAKTASLYAAACELGARYPAGREELGFELGRFGWDIGLAFQIADDCLDVTGNQADVGKSVGNDVEDGKVTLPVLYTYRNADAETRARMRDVFTLPGLEQRAARLREVVDLEPGVAYSLERARRLVRAAGERLGGLPASPAKAALESLGEFVLERRW